MKKVLLTVNNNKLSGIEKFTLLLGKHLDKGRYKVDVGIPTYGPFCKILEENKINYFVFDNKVNGRFTFSGIRFLFKRMLSEKYDIVHAQGGISPCVIGKMIGSHLLIEHKHGLDFTSEQIEEMGVMRLSYEKLKKYFVHLTFTGCEADKKVLTERFKYDPQRVQVIYNGIENNPKGIQKQKHDKFTIGTIGRLTFQKGHEYFIEMAKILKDRGYDFEYHIYGDGEKLIDYRYLIDKNKLADNVFLKGYTDNIIETLNTFDLFVLSSRYEGIPYVILEAMKESVPVISTDVGGISEVIIDNFNGILVKKENAEEMAEKAIVLYNSEHTRQYLSQNAKKDFDEKYTIEKTIKDIDSAYSEL